MCVDCIHFLEIVNGSLWINARDIMRDSLAFPGGSSPREINSGKCWKRESEWYSWYNSAQLCDPTFIPGELHLPSRAPSVGRKQVGLKVGGNEKGGERERHLGKDATHLESESKSRSFDTEIAIAANRRKQLYASASPNFGSFHWEKDMFGIFVTVIAPKNAVNYGEKNHFFFFIEFYCKIKNYSLICVLLLLFYDKEYTWDWK